VSAIKRVYASMFTRRAQAYLKTTFVPARRREDGGDPAEGRRRGARQPLYPNVSGCARDRTISYPVAPMRAEDGIVAAALGFGETVMTAAPASGFCPRYSAAPDAVLSPSARFSKARSASSNALPLHDPLLDGETTPGGELQLFRSGGGGARPDARRRRPRPTRPKTTSSPTAFRRGGVRPRDVCADPQHRLLQLAEMLDLLLRISADGELARRWRSSSRSAIDPARRATHDFGFLQLRPLALSREGRGFCRLATCRRTRSSARAPASSATAVSKRAISWSSIFTGSDIAAAARTSRADVARFNAELAREGVPYVLIGVGRWGSAEPFLGIAR